MGGNKRPNKARNQITGSGQNRNADSAPWFKNKKQKARKAAKAQKAARRKNRR